MSMGNKLVRRNDGGREMREILFRGKRTDDGEWVYGSFVMDALEQKNGLCGVDGFIRLYNPTLSKVEMFEVDRETVGQYTGLTDKNGKKIFEGDILAVRENRKVYQTVQVHYNNGAFRVSHFAIDVLECRNTESEVIGNIHDNSDLLKGGAE